MSVARKRIEELSALLAEDQLREVVDFMTFLKDKDEKAMREGLMTASESTLDFWDNNVDEVWNHV